ncbi:hypothetical protein Nepgr_009787 [Nepenthes gracilis]|uniref:Uncharacterized protein n=1 Tax=Nepenthes gracilis TaxID=150966 RepID=A0AAD3XKG9_NEPGR|nr:hypothetical protein Nepgr_009787 [Nepenthes gracilis]
MKNITYFVILLLARAVFVAGDCTCDAENLPTDSRSATLRYRVTALFAILAAGAVGVTMPLLGKIFPVLSPENDIFFVIKAFAAGVILSTGFIHILPDAFDSLTSPCLKQSVWQVFPFAGFGAMIGSVGTLMIDSWATGFYRRKHFKEKGDGRRPASVDDEMNADHAGHIHIHTHASHGHSHASAADGAAEEELSRLELIRHRVTAQVLELGIMVHSVIIGITLGASQSLKTIKPLMVALCFHQFFEGMGLGGCISLSKFESRAAAIMALFFSVTTPLGVGIGIGISKVYSDNDPTSLIVQGLFDSVAAGILIYMALVDLLAADFTSTRMQTNAKLQLGSNVSMLVGAGCMSVLAKWA